MTTTASHRLPERAHDDDRDGDGPWVLDGHGPRLAGPGPRATLEIARRTLRKFVRTPGLWVMGIVQSALFLFSFRFVFGGAIHTGALTYVDFLVPGYVATIVLFTGGGIAVAVAEDRVQGFTDRLLSLPLPRSSIVLGRTLADSATNTWAIVSTAAFGFLFGFRLRGSVVDGLAALGLCLALRRRLHRRLHRHRPGLAQRPGGPGHVHDRLRPGLLLQHLRPRGLHGRAGSNPSPSTSPSPPWSTPSVPCWSAPPPTSAWPWPGRRCCSSSSPRWPWPATADPDILPVRFPGLLFLAKC